MVNGGGPFAFDSWTKAGEKQMRGEKEWNSWPVGKILRSWEEDIGYKRHSHKIRMMSSL